MGRPVLTEQDREQRRRVLLDAAHRLYRERNTLPPVADIASAAGLAKGTVYLYFRTKEEIFVALLEDSFAQLFTALAPLLTALDMDQPGAAARFARAYTQLVRDSGDLLQLAALGNTVLEKNLPLEAMQRFKLNLAQGMTQAGALLEQGTRARAPGWGATLLLQTYGLTLGLWQALDFPDALRALLQQPALRVLERDFHAELEAAVERLWSAAFN
ncbi:TetR family transcriptional regulator [Duganella sp. LX20W]|uniref:TetR family transcriptional regulator n=1 Tax=Rugamonas brunnea TaxID=2758569 RepID=A0A7W2EWB6_9BURK|nr:TetR family transcriptional regulator [Rugamonas brunnea]MBA5639833.1 TetR family transcriptional regulator [Rugamonas brunnea]